MSDEKKLMKFDVVVGNPPYQEHAKDDLNKAMPLYPYFYNLAKQVSDIYCLVTPGRFLFGAGATSKSWNEDMLSDEYLSVLLYESDSKKLFPNNDIKGGISVLYRNSRYVTGPIGIFTAYNELNSILRKVQGNKIVSSLVDIFYGISSYKYSNELPDEYEEIRGKGVKTNAFSRWSPLFSEVYGNDSVQLYGRYDNQRTSRYISSKYVQVPDNFEYYKVLVPAANGSGAIGEVLSTPLIGDPLIGHTPTFLSFGKFNNKLEAENLLKYIKSKFARTMLGVKKVTQHNTSKDVWSCVPLQDFTDKSDIDWSKDIAEIDQQLYKKYGLSEDEIEFIETKVKTMD